MTIGSEVNKYGQCQCLTATRNRCPRPIYIDGRCWQHHRLNVARIDQFINELPPRLEDLLVPNEAAQTINKLKEENAALKTRVDGLLQNLTYWKDEAIRANKRLTREATEDSGDD